MYEIPTTILYVSNKKQIEGVLKTCIVISEKNEIEKEDFVKLIGSHNIFKRKHYLILDILKYQIPITSSEDCKLYLKRPNLMDTFVYKGWKYSNDMAWSNTCDDFKPINSLILLFKEKFINPNGSQNKSKKQNGTIQQKNTKRNRALQLN